VSTDTPLEKIRAQMENPLPTPPVGLGVQWFEMDETDRCYAAKVTRVEGPGKVQLIIFKPSAMAQHKQGVLHRSHPVHQNRHATETMRNGSWDYLPGITIPKTHREFHLSELKRREANILEQQRIAESQAAALKAKTTTA